jgi:hypothetical protein
VIYQKVFEIVMMILMLTSMQTTETTLYGIWALSFDFKSTHKLKTLDIQFKKKLYLQQDFIRSRIQRR